MSFRKLGKPARSTASGQPIITLATSTANRQTYLSINTAARRLLGEPAAVFFEFDDDVWLLRVVASSPEDPAAYPLGKTGRVSITGMIRDLGVRVTDTVRLPVTKDGRLAVTVDLSDLPSSGTVQALRPAS